jgi:hypothetical protein
MLPWAYASGLGSRPENLRKGRCAARHALPALAWACEARPGRGDDQLAGAGPYNRRASHGHAVSSSAVGQ